MAAYLELLQGEHALQDDDFVPPGAGVWDCGGVVVVPVRELAMKVVSKILGMLVARHYNWWIPSLGLSTKGISDKSEEHSAATGFARSPRICPYRVRNENNR